MEFFGDLGVVMFGIIEGKKRVFFWGGVFEGCVEGVGSNKIESSFNVGEV